MRQALETRSDVELPTRDHCGAVLLTFNKQNMPALLCSIHEHIAKDRNVEEVVKRKTAEVFVCEASPNASGSTRGPHDPHLDDNLTKWRP